MKKASVPANILAKQCLFELRFIQAYFVIAFSGPLLVFYVCVKCKVQFEM